MSELDDAFLSLLLSAFLLAVAIFAVGIVAGVLLFKP